MKNILVFEPPKKCVQFKKYLGKAKLGTYHYSYDPDKALKKALKIKPEIIILGGDLNSKNFKAVRLCNMLSEFNLDKKQIVYITTWDTDEARVLRDMMPSSFYCPFSQTLVEIVKARVRIKKNPKNSKEVKISPKENEKKEKK